MTIKVKVKEKKSTADRLMPFIALLMVGVLFGGGYFLLKDADLSSNSSGSSAKKDKPVRQVEVVANSDEVKNEEHTPNAGGENQAVIQELDLPNYREWPVEDYASRKQYVQHRLQFTTDEPESNSPQAIRTIFSMMPNGGDIRAVVKHNEMQSEQGVCCTHKSVIRSMNRRFVSYEIEGSDLTRNTYVFDLDKRKKYPVWKTKQQSFADFTYDSKHLVIVGKKSTYWFDIAAKKLIKKPFHFKDILGFSMLKNGNYLIYKQNAFYEYGKNGDMIRKLSLGKRKLTQVIQHSLNKRYFVIQDSSLSFFLFDVDKTKKYPIKLGKFYGIKNIAISNDGKMYAAYDRVLYRLRTNEAPYGLFRVPSNINIRHLSYID